MPWLLIAVGLYLVLSFGTWLLSNYPFLPSSQALALCATRANEPEAGLKHCTLIYWDVARVQHTVIITIFGVALLLLGVGRLVTQALREMIDPSPTAQAANRRRRPGPDTAAVARACWALGELLLVPGCNLLLLVVLLTLVTSLARGLPPSLDLVDAAIDRALNVALTLAGITLPV